MLRSRELSTWKVLCRQLGEWIHHVPWNPKRFFTLVIFHSKLVAILTLLGVQSGGRGDVGFLHLRPLMPEFPKFPEPAMHWSCVNLLVLAAQQPAISQASSTCVCGIESFLWGYCLRLQTMEGNREPV